LSTYKFIHFFINRSAEGKKSPRWWLNGWAQSDPVQVLGTDLQSQGKVFRKAVPLGTPLAAEGSKQTPSLLLVLLQKSPRFAPWARRGDSHSASTLGVNLSGGVFLFFQNRSSF
jgi:hypothetical protein